MTVHDPRAEVRICADGGANRLAAALTEAELRAFPPHIVVGDMDSADPQVGGGRSGPLIYGLRAEPSA